MGFPEKLLNFFKFGKSNKFAEECDLIKNSQNVGNVCFFLKKNTWVFRNKLEVSQNR